MSDKSRRVLHIICACIAITAAVVAFLLTPVGKRIVGKQNTTVSESTTTPVQSDMPNTASDTSVQSTAVGSTVPMIPEAASVTVPKPTEGTTDPYKNYTFYIDKKTFDYTLQEGVTTLVAKDNSAVKMTVKPIKTQSYGEYCSELLDNYGSMGESERLDIKSTNSAFQSQTGDKDNDIITTVYCVDDGKGGCIEIKYQTPVSAKYYAEKFEVLLSMFKVL